MASQQIFPASPASSSSSVSPSLSSSSSSTSTSPFSQDTRCSDCRHFIPDPAKPGFGFCFGILIPESRTPVESEKCGGKYFRKKEKGS